MFGKNSTYLKGLRIVDLSSLLPAPFAAHLLAKNGAEVIKVESPNRPDPVQNYGFRPEGKSSSFYRAVNSNKTLKKIDLKSDAGRKELFEILKSADGLIEGYRPDVRKRLGLEYDAIHKINPKLVYCSITGFSDPDHAKLAGHDINFLAKTGISDLTRDENGTCVPIGAPFADFIVAFAAAFRMTAAMLGAKLSGKGVHIELPIEEALLEAQSPFLFELKESGITPKAGGTFITGLWPCYTFYTLKDGTLSIGALEEKFWANFCNAINRKDLIDKQYATDDECIQIKKEVTQELSKKSFSDWVQVFLKEDCCVEPVVSQKDVIRGL